MLQDVSTMKTLCSINNPGITTNAAQIYLFEEPKAVKFIDE